MPAIDFATLLREERNRQRQQLADKKTESVDISPASRAQDKVNTCTTGRYHTFAKARLPCLYRSKHHATCVRKGRLDLIMLGE